MTVPRERLTRNHEGFTRAAGGSEFDRRDADHRVAADLIADGVLRFHHLGLKPIKIGRRNIDWTGSHHNHQEWRCQLHRFFTLPSLAHCYRETGDEKYAQTAADIVSDWIAAHPTKPGWQCTKYDNTLNLAIRLGMWFGSLPAFLTSPAVTDELIESMMASAEAQIDYLLPRIATHMNWRIAQADALLATGIRVDFHPQAGAWRERGVRILNEAFHRQVLPEGVHAERNPSYHGWMTTVYERYWRLAKAMPELGLHVDTAKLARMFDYACAVTRPNGDLNAMHDCTGRMSGPRKDTWLAKRSAFRKLVGLLDDTPPTTQWFRDAGQFFLRDSWNEDATYLTFDATIWGGGHCHLSRNALQVHAHGRSLLVDPGTLTYEGSDPKSAYGRATRAHATCNLNGWNQSSDDPVSRHDSAPGYDLVRSLYRGSYWPHEMNWQFIEGHGQGVYGEHHRTMLWVRDRFILVIDHLFHDCQANEKPDLQCNWPLSPGPVTLDAERGIAHTGHDDANLLLLFALRPPTAMLRVHEGESTPEAGWVPGDNAYTPAPLIRLTTPKQDPYDTHFVTLLVPYKGTQVPRVELAQPAKSPEVDGCGRLVFRWGDGTTDDFWFVGRQEVAIDRRGDIETDAGLVHIHRDSAGKAVKALIVDGTYLRPFTRDVRETMGVYAVTPDSGAK